MKICVTGVCGFIGSELLKKLKEANFKVIGIDKYDRYKDLPHIATQLDEIGRAHV